MRTSCGTILAAAVAVVGGAIAAAGANEATITVDLEDVRAEVPRSFYGTGMEDVNHEIYGGLDAQRLYDESFEETLPRQAHPRGSGSRCAFGLSCGRQWDDIAAGGGRLAVVTNVAHLGIRSQMLEPGAGSADVANSGLNGWGIPCRAGRKMVGHMYVRGSAGRLEVRLWRRDASAEYARQALEARGGDGWRKVCFALVPDATDPAASFAIVASGGGKVYVDDVYLADEPTNEFGRMGCREDRTTDRAHCLSLRPETHSMSLRLCARCRSARRKGARLQRLAGTAQSR
ncbi:MAG: hypothetical protein IKE55_10760 [Kiritimatiellae bacterium]|nr:hypothetical protein [Kiritimatiellia bacterium]